jgi:hypothetical protein
VKDIGSTWRQVEVKGRIIFSRWRREKSSSADAQPPPLGLVALEVSGWSRRIVRRLRL